MRTVWENACLVSREQYKCIYIYINRTLSSPVEMANFLKLIPVKQISVWEKQLTPTFWPTINLLERREEERVRKSYTFSKGVANPPFRIEGRNRGNGGATLWPPDARHNGSDEKSNENVISIYFLYGVVSEELSRQRCRLVGRGLVRAWVDRRIDRFLFSSRAVSTILSIDGIC